MAFNIDQLPKSASMEVAALARKLIQEGKDVISLSIGDTHFNLPDKIKQRVNQAMDDGHTHYSIAQGELILRNSIAEYYNGIYDPGDIIITHGVKNGMLGLLMAIDQHKIAVLEPAWLGYEGLCMIAEKEVIGINMQNRDFIETLKKTDFEVLILCSPNNPDGRVFTKTELVEIYGVATNKNALIFLDEIYREYSYTSTFNNSLLYGKDNVVIFNGFSKSHAATGLRIGYLAVKSSKLIENLVKLQQNTLTCPSTIGQYGFVDFQTVSKDVAAFSEYYSQNMLLVQEIIPELKEFEPKSGFYYFFDLNAFGIEMDAITFCQDLLRKEGLALIPGNAYGNNLNNYVRLSFCVDREVLQKGVMRLKHYFENGQSN